jgi:hypothetical protein
VSWRREFQAGAVALGVLALISVAGAAVHVSGTGGSAKIADATGVAGVTYQVSAKAQHDARAYWTTDRMWATADGMVETQAAVLTSPPKGIPTASKFNGSPTTGALFYTTGGKAHFCSASVVDSPQGDLLLTAAHCVYDKSVASNVEYVPEYHDGKDPYGTWPVRAITVTYDWKTSHDTDFDFAFLAVSPENRKSIQATTNGLTLGINLSDNQKIEVIGHNDTDNEPVRCATKSFWFRTGQMEFYCHGFWTGTSGGPWIIGYNAANGEGKVFGVIGGYEGGGDYEWTSYSSYFGDTARSLYRQAESEPAPKPTPTASPTPSPSKKPSAGTSYPAGAARPGHPSIGPS